MAASASNSPPTVSSPNPTAATTTQTTLPLPDAFSHSCARWTQYPTNLVPRTTGMNPSALKAYFSKLDVAESKLFTHDHNTVEVCFRDLEVEGVGALAKYNVHDELKLGKWLGITKIRDPAKHLINASKKDPKSRLIYIYAEHSRDPLRIQRSMLTMILSFHQVMPEYLDFLWPFGLQSTPQDVRFSGFRQQLCLKKPPRSLVIDALGRSGQQYQMSYNLKGVTLKDDGEWSIRNAAFCHQYDVMTSRAVWIVTKGGMDLYENYKELTGSDGRPEDKAFGSDEECFVSSLSPHLLFSRWSTEDWRGFLRWLESEVDNDAALAVLGPREEGHHPKRYHPRDIRRMQIWEERANEAIVVLEGNVDVLSALRQFYLNLSKDDRFPLGQSCLGEIKDFASELEAMISDLKNNIGRAKALTKTTMDRKELMKQYRGDESAERMHRLNKNMEEEAIVVRIVTLVTLIYLPATFVSTFFSTDIVKYQVNDFPEGKFNDMAMYRWLQVTLPLTFLTLFAAWAAKAWASNQSQEGSVLEVGDVVVVSDRVPIGERLLGLGQWVRSRRTPTQSTAKTLLPTTSGVPLGPVAGGKSAAG
ncbi:hypothetical protein QBC37DRAFT_431673 [Rhypophila decipiens]|uniref:CorA-like transporter domain-containing protein n=1 Tax=Rhypophila decipiens TaxID=261697 RepID=A0AAN7B5A1_9PEZI|nr:hypothetical protein QBC37DRAFT_431673 [Rhypophila decipiens]